MRRGAHALTYVSLFALAACGKNIDDAANFTGNGDGTPVGTASSGDSTSVGVADDSGMDQGQDGTTAAADDAPVTTMPAEDTGPPASTGAVDDGMMDDAAGGCGDGMVSPGEQCDGADLQGFDCSSLGLAGGTLSCDAVTCTFDTSMCMSNGGGTGGM